MPEPFIRVAIKKHLGVEPMKAERLSSLSNVVYRIDFEDRRPVIFRVKNKTEPNLFLFRSEENEKRLMEVGYFTDLILADTDDYRIERFIENKPIKVGDVRSHETRILFMRAIADFHNLMPPGTKKDALIIDTWQSVWPQIRSKIHSNYQETAQGEKVGAMVAEMEDWLLHTLVPSPLFDQTVFCHNDLLAGNLLFNKETNRLCLIDFEYCGYASQESDVYNLLIESSYDYDDTLPQGFEQDTSVFPTDPQLREIIRFYLFFRRHPGAFPDLPDFEQSIETFRLHPGFAQVTEPEIDRFVEKMFLVGNVQNLLWAVWCFYIKQKEGVVLDYTTFAYSRFQDFRRCRERYEQLTYPQTSQQ